MMQRRIFVWALGALALTGCGDIFGPDTHSSIERARVDWIAHRTSSYTFEVTTASSWFSAQSYSVTVVNDSVTQSVHLASGAVTTGGAPTIDDIWDQILRSRDRNEIHSARFDKRGVPISVNMGPWEADGGVSFEVRHFTPR